MIAVPHYRFLTIKLHKEAILLMTKQKSESEIYNIDGS